MIVILKILIISTSTRFQVVCSQIYRRDRNLKFAPNCDLEVDNLEIN